MPEAEWGPFLKEERKLLQEIASYIGAHIERTEVKKEIKKFKTLADKANYGVSIINMKNVITYANNYCAKVHGYKPEDIIGKKMSVFFTKEQMKVMERILKEVIKNGGVSAIEVWHKHRNGKLFPMFMNSALIKDRNGKPIFIANSATDITEKKEMEERLRESEENYRNFFESANDLIQSLDPKGNFIYVNKKWIETLGYTREEVKKLNAFDVIRKDYEKHCKEIIKRISKGERLENVETVFVAKNGKEIYVEGNLSGRFKNGKFIATFGIFRDVTESRKMERELKARTKELEKANIKANQLVEELKKSQKELQDKVEELERFRRITINRELKMIELKKKIKRLEESIEKLKESR